jgi:hypothetical protein
MFPFYMSNSTSNLFSAYYFSRRPFTVIFLVGDLSLALSLGNPAVQQKYNWIRWFVARTREVAFVLFTKFSLAFWTSRGVFRSKCIVACTLPNFLRNRMALPTTVFPVYVKDKHDSGNIAKQFNFIQTDGFENMLFVFVFVVVASGK